MGKNVKLVKGIYRQIIHNHILTYTPKLMTLPGIHYRVVTYELGTKLQLRKVKVRLVENGTRIHITPGIKQTCISVAKKVW